MHQVSLPVYTWNKEHVILVYGSMFEIMNASLFGYTNKLTIALVQ